jgi:N-acetylmuramoyl-L-alanine amidase
VLRISRGLRSLAAAVLAAGVLLVPVAAHAAEQGGRTYEVRRGDTLTRIARAHGTTVQAIVSANTITDPNRVTAGTVLVIPSGSGAAPAPSPSAPSASGATITVRAGEGWFAVARRANVRPSELTRANGATYETPLLVGQVLRLPAGGTPSRTLPSEVTSSSVRMSYVPVFEQAAARHRLPVDLLMAMCWQESTWRADIVSSVGAVGVCQLMPVTSQWLANQHLRRPALNPTVAADNIEMGAAYLRYLLDLNGGNEDRALAAYYQGHWGVQRDGVNAGAAQHASAVQALRVRFR